MSQEKENTSFDALFKQKLEGHEMVGSDALWADVNGDLAGLDAEIKNRKKFAYLKWLSGGLFVLLLSTIFYYEWRLTTIKSNDLIGYNELKELNREKLNQSQFNYPISINKSRINSDEIECEEETKSSWKKNEVSSSAQIKQNELYEKGISNSFSKENRGM